MNKVFIRQHFSHLLSNFNPKNKLFLKYLTKVLATSHLRETDKSCVFFHEFEQIFEFRHFNVVDAPVEVTYDFDGVRHHS